MLNHLHIENYALIRNTDIEFESGFVAITGETGAGKSIMLGALGLLLGQRADTHVLLDLESKCIVEAEFWIQKKEVSEYLTANDIDTNEDGTLILRREILPSGKTRAFVNDTPVSLNILKTIGPQLIDIHSQHETLLLADSGFQIDLLDSIHRDQNAIDEYRRAYGEYTQLKRTLEELTQEEQRQSKNLDYNQFLYEELVNAHLKEGEQEELEQELELMTHAEQVQQTLAEITELISQEEAGVLQRLNSTKTRLGKIVDYHKDFGDLYSRIDSTLIELRDIADTLETIGDGMTFSAERKSVVEERIELIYKLEHKHEVENIEALKEIAEVLEQQISAASDNSERIKECMERVDKAYGRVQQWGESLHKLRTKAGEEIEQEILPLLASVGMPNARIGVDIEKTAVYGVRGCDKVALRFNANKGGGLKDIAHSASGGEMSRLMLSIKALTARTLLLPTVIFDEIDSGISGDISVKVGKIMLDMSCHMQVIAITHLPQIAAGADQHYKVYKSADDEMTTSKIRLLNRAERQYEIATMLSSEPPTDAALQTANELMSGSGKEDINES